MHVGLILIDEDVRQSLAIAVQADNAGVHSIWTIDYYNRSSLTRAASFAAATSRCLVGTSITPLFARAPLAISSAARDIQAISEGRFVLGVGTSTRRMNSDWYGVALEHPAPRLEERAGLVRALMAHVSGPLSFDGRFDQLRLAHFDQGAGWDLPPVPIYAAGVGPRMIEAVARVADGFVGHPIASADYLRDFALPALASARPAGQPTLVRASQVIAAVDRDAAVARRWAAQQVAFYSTVKGYDALFPDGEFAAERAAIRAAFANGDLRRMADIGDALVETRAVFGTVADVTAQLGRYAGVLDVALLYPPHFGVEIADVAGIERALVEVAACPAS